MEDYISQRPETEFTHAMRSDCYDMHMNKKVES